MRGSARPGRPRLPTKTGPRGRLPEHAGQDRPAPESSCRTRSLGSSVLVSAQSSVLVSRHGWPSWILLGYISASIRARHAMRSPGERYTGRQRPSAPRWTTGNPSRRGVRSWRHERGHGEVAPDRLDRHGGLRAHEARCRNRIQGAASWSPHRSSGCHPHAESAQDPHEQRIRSANKNSRGDHAEPSWRLLRAVGRC